MTPYSISCSTCGARLKVRDERAIGELSLCPKCGSMVMITPPSPETEAPPAPGASAPKTADSSPQVVVGGGMLANEFDDAAALLSDTIDDAPPRSQPDAPAKAKQTEGEAPAHGEDPKREKSQREQPSRSQQDRTEAPAGTQDAASQPDSSKKKQAAAVAVVATTQPPDANPAPPPIEPPTESMSSIELEPTAARAQSSALAQAGAAHVPAAPHAPAEATAGAALPPPVAPDTWNTPAQLAWQRYGLIGAATLAAIVVVGGLLAFLFRGPRDEPVVVEDATPANVEPIPDVDGSTDGSEPIGFDDDDNAGATDDGPPSSPDNESTPPDESSGSDSELPDAEPPVPPDNGNDRDDENPLDAPPIFAADDPAEKPIDEPTADTGLGDFAPLIDAFHVPPAPKRQPVEGEPSDAPAPVATATTSRPRPDPVNVNVDARLADKISGINTRGASLSSVLELVTQLSTIPITISPEALTQRKLSADTPVAIDLRETSVEGILKAVLGPKGLAFKIVDDQIVVVSARSLGTMPTVPHEVDDLVDSAEESQALANTIKALIEPESWVIPGGVGNILTDGTTLDIANSFDTQFRVHIFLQKLRVARVLAPRSKFDNKLFALTSRTERADAKLKTRVRAVYHVEQPLIKVLNHLEKSADVKLLVDWQALGEAGWPPQSTAAVVADGVPLAEALDELLAPMDLTWRAIDDDTLQVTSVKALTHNAELEFYPVADLLAAKGISGGDLIGQLREELGPGLFVGGGGKYDIRFDAPSKTLLVRLPQAHQRMLEGLLRRMSDETADEGDG